MPNPIKLALMTSLIVGLGAAVPSVRSGELIRLANDPALSPDGSTLVFAWRGDLWSVPSEGGTATLLTRNDGKDQSPAFSPDGTELAFTSDRGGSPQPYVMPARGGVPRQVGFHSAGTTVREWTPDGSGLLVSGPRDYHWRDGDRFFLLKVQERVAEVPLFDSAGENGSLSPDGKRLLFNREGVAWWRKGYKGSQDSQIWLFDLPSQSFTKLLDPAGGALWPLWKPDGKGFYYVGIHKDTLNLREFDLETKQDRALTEFEDDSVVFPCLSRDGSTLVFRRLFDFYRFRPGRNEPPKKLEILVDGDEARDPIERRTLTQASEVAFSNDGLEVAFIAGGDLWVMDTELKEPRRVTETPEEERSPVFSPKGDALLFVSDAEGQTDVWKAERGDPGKDWWLNSSFKRERITNDPETESDLKWSPEGSKLAFVKGRGDLIVTSPDGKDSKRILASWNEPSYDWSPDGKWMAYTVSDHDFNSDVWITPIDGSRPPFNVSRHPDNEGPPAWSPDGKVIAFTGRRVDSEVDVHFVWLREDEDDKESRDRTIEKAIEKIKKVRKKGASPTARKPETPEKDKDDDKDMGDESKDAESAKPKIPEVVIDFDRIHERIRRISVPNSTEDDLFWSPDSKKLAFSGSIDGKSGIYTVEFPDDLKPKLLSATRGRQPRWIEEGRQIVWLVSGVPASLTSEGKETSYRFRALQSFDRAAKFRAGFDQCWRVMRDRWYDERLGNRNWDAIRRKYLEMAERAPDSETFGAVVNLMLGELNGSHLGFYPGVRSRPGPGPSPPASETPEPRWRESTAHLGLRFDPTFKGPGLKVRDVIPGGPTDKKATRVEPGEIVLSIDGTSVDPALDLTKVLNGPPDRDVTLTIRGKDEKSREIVIRPMSYSSASSSLYDKWVKDNREAVETLSEGKLGYLHIRGMDFPSFYKFEEELYSAGSGKEGLVIDVRENGGGSTADHLLTALTQPHHAITVPRGGGPGYPQDRRVYATWNKPIVVLCNQNSFSNAEIFSHAVKTLKRGKLVGVPTAGGVISTGGTPIMDVGFLRLPGRGWYLVETGEDMELNGAVPDVVLWPDPADFAKGRDAQLARAVEVLREEVQREQARPRPKLRKSTERETFTPAAAK
ncbi:MAG: S41 family peptidase [Isosphaeraceae bacterium]